MIDFITNLLARAEPRISEASVRDAPDMAALHATSFHRGWSEDEFERLLIDRAVVAHRITMGRQLVGFAISRMASGEAEILSVAVAAARRRKGLARRMLDLHLQLLARLGTRMVFLEVNEDNAAATRLYERAGFRPVGRREGYYPGRKAEVPGAADHGAAALVLRCELA